MCPEYRLRTKAYNVPMNLNENDSKIIKCQCPNCAASVGGCKCAVAFLKKKTTLSKVRIFVEYITLQQMSKKKYLINFLLKLFQKTKKTSCLKKSFQKNTLLKIFINKPKFMLTGIRFNVDNELKNYLSDINFLLLILRCMLNYLL